MKHHARVLVLIVACIVTATEVFGQGTQTGTIRGLVLDASALVLPGVVVTVRSEALQGVRTATTGAAGTYELLGLPPGTYTILFQLDGFGDIEEHAMVPLGGTIEVNAFMDPRPVAETVWVTDVVPSAVASTQTSQNLNADEIERLPVGRDLFRIAELAPGLTANAPTDGQLTISGAFGYDNVILLDGSDITDNIFATPNDLFIEDAIRETQVLTSGISAEYGRFSGGVVNAITRSGGNAFSGSFRANLYKPDWTEPTPFEVENGIERTGTLGNNTTYETTLGGPIARDRLWFYYANRVQREAQVGTFNQTGQTYDEELSNDRNLFKLTGRLAEGHRVEGSYMRNQTEELGPSFPFTIDPMAVVEEQQPNDLVVATYRGAATPRLFAELQFSRRQRGFRNWGGASSEIVESPFLTLTQSFAHYNAPYLDSSDPQDRDNRQFTGNVTYFADSSTLGSHSIKAGFEHFTSTLRGGNSQSSTGYVFVADYATGSGGAPVTDAEGRLLPVFVPGASVIQRFRPQRGSTLDITTRSFFVNDTWQLGSHFTFNLGLRSEAVHSVATVDAGEIDGLDAGTVVPRLSAAVDPLGDGRFTVQATYGHYAGRYSEAQFNRNTNVGNPDTLVGIYMGPAGQGRTFGPGFDVDNYMIVQSSSPLDVVFEDDLSSPLTREFTLGGGAALGPRGYTRVTFVHRTTSDLVEDFFTLDGGSTTVIEDGINLGTFTNQVFRNTDRLERTYAALEFLGRYQVTSQFVVDGTVTIQIDNDGDFVGEAANQPGLASPAFDFPEITPRDRYFPVGRLNGFQRHKTRIFGIYTLDLGSAGDLDIGGIWRYDSGRVYSLARRNAGLTDAQRRILVEAGYPDGPSSQGRDVYFAAGRGSETHPGYGLLDLSFQYSIPVWRSLRPWVKAEIFNVFNNDTQIGADTTVAFDPDGPVDELGLPTAFVEGARFGQPTSVDHYPHYLPNLDGLRTFRVAMGFRF